MKKLKKCSLKSFSIFKASNETEQVKSYQVLNVRSMQLLFMSQWSAAFQTWTSKHEVSQCHSVINYGSLLVLDKSRKKTANLWVTDICSFMGKFSGHFCLLHTTCLRHRDLHKTFRL